LSARWPASEPRRGVPRWLPRSNTSIPPARELLLGGRQRRPDGGACPGARHLHGLSAAHGAGEHECSLQRGEKVGWHLPEREARRDTGLLHLDPRGPWRGRPGGRRDFSTTTRNRKRPPSHAVASGSFGPKSRPPRDDKGAPASHPGLRRELRCMHPVRSRGEVARQEPAHNSRALLAGSATATSATASTARTKNTATSSTSKTSSTASKGPQPTIREGPSKSTTKRTSPACSRTGSRRDARGCWRSNRFKEREVFSAVHEELGQYATRADEIFEINKSQREN
jgi:hypothetical protein